VASRRRGEHNGVQGGKAPTDVGEAVESRRYSEDSRSGCKSRAHGRMKTTSPKTVVQKQREIKASERRD